jgi:hypothetical protein
MMLVFLVRRISEEKRLEERSIFAEMDMSRTGSLYSTAIKDAKVILADTRSK